MKRRIKILILLLCALCAFSAFALTAFADETSDGYPYLTIMKGVGCKTEYTEGEEFSTAYFYGRIFYSADSSTFFYPNELDYLEKGPLTLDTTYITFVVDGLTYELPITVNPSPVPLKYVTGIEVSTTKTEYLALDTIDISSFSANLVYSDGSLEPLDLDLCSFYPSLDTPLSSFNNSIYVTYSIGGTDYSEHVNISVSPVLSLDVAGLKNVKLYEASEPGIPNGITVTAYYDELKTVSKTITEFDVSYDSDIIKADENGKTKISILVDSLSYDAEVEVLPIVNYRVTGFKNAYYYGDSFSAADIKVIAIYSDLTTYNVTEQVEFTAPETIVAGSSITATHNGFDLKDFINTSLPEGKLIVINEPNKLKYEIGEIFDSTGLSVAVEYSDGNRVLLSASEYTVTASAPLTAADKFVIVGYYGISANISISVGDEAYIVSLNLAGAPDVMSYFEGNVLNTSGLIIEAYLSDGTKTIVNPNMLTFVPALGTPLTTDVTEVKISANDGTDKYCEISFPITVNKKLPTLLGATSLPNKLEYAEGETFDPDGLQLVLYFNDSSSIVPSSFTFSPELGSNIILHSNAPEKCIIYAVYEYEGTEYTFPIEITVTPAETSNLLIARYPSKTVYEIGDEFDPEGLELILVYKDGNLKYPRVPEGYYTYSPSVITQATKEITISFRGLTVTVPITVNGVETPEVTTDPIDPPMTTDPIPPETTEGNDSSDVTTAEDPEVSTEPETSDSEITTDADITTSPDITTEPDVTTEDSSGSGKTDPSSLLYLWIIIIVIIIVALIALIIYYKKNFT